MLVIFKSAPILKKILRVKQSMLQLYALKLLKMQTRHLGRQWRKTNMSTMSAIYQKVRHRLNDDWAFGNEQETQVWSFVIIFIFSLKKRLNIFVAIKRHGIFNRTNVL